MKRSQRAKREGKSPSTQAGEFVREEIHYITRSKASQRAARMKGRRGRSLAARKATRTRARRK